MKLQHQITLSDIADKLQLSPSTISKGLTDHESINIKTKKRIRQMAEQLGYKANTGAQSLRMGKTNSIGLMIPSITGLKYAEILGGIESVLADYGLNILLVQTQAGIPSEATGSDDLFHSEISALIICMGYPMTHKNYLDKLIRKGTPIISIDTPVYPGVSTHWLDHQGILRAGLDHLAKASCKHIGLVITENLDEQTKIAYKDGYRSALRAQRSHQKNDNIFEYDITPDAAQQAAREILSRDIIPDGLFFTDDYFAIAVMKELQTRSVSVPHEMAILGLGHAEVSELVIPSLSSIDYLYKEMGRDIANFVITSLDKRKPEVSSTDLSRYDLKIRDTTSRFPESHKRTGIFS